MGRVDSEQLLEFMVRSRSRATAANGASLMHGVKYVIISLTSPRVGAAEVHRSHTVGIEIDRFHIFVGTIKHRMNNNKRLMLKHETIQVTVTASSLLFR